MRQFLEALNAGDPTAIDSAIAPGLRFGVYSQTQRYGNRTRGFFTSKDRSRVVAHLVQRHAKGDRYRVRGLDPNGFDRAFDICNLGFVLKRRIGGGPWRPFVGKGALDQPSGRVSVWNIGGQVRNGPADGNDRVSAALSPADTCPGVPASPHRPRIAVFGQVAFPRYADPGDRIPARFIDRRPGQRLFSKMGLYVRGAQPITLTVDDPALMAWARQGLSSQITLEQGPRCAGAGWHAYPGGLIVPTPGSCVRLSVVVGARSKTVPFGVGIRC